MFAVFSRAARGLAFFIGLAGVAHAGSISVSPVRATLTAGQPVSALTVRNTGDEPAVVQLEAVGWSQANGKDVYDATRELLATPPIFTVPPGGSQVVRIGLRRAPDAQRELTYRLFLQEVPPPPSPGFRGLRMALRIGVPVFVLPKTQARPLTEWQVRRAADGKLRVSVTNTGTAHIQVANFRLVPARGEPIPVQQVAAYVLPGQQRAWLIGDDGQLPEGMPLKLRAQTDAGDVDAELAVQ